MSGFNRAGCVIMGLLVESHQITTCNISCCLKVEFVFDQLHHYSLSKFCHTSQRFCHLQWKMVPGIWHTTSSHSLLDINSLWLSYAIWWHWSALTQVIDFGLIAQSHNLNQCWLDIHQDILHSPESNFTACSKANILYNELYLSNYFYISKGSIS